MRLSLDELVQRERQAQALWTGTCRLCARYCQVDRTRGEEGLCRLDDAVHLAGWGIHFGEEPELTGERGCGLVLLGGCNLSCKGCETASFSRKLQGVTRCSAAQLAGVLLELERRGASTVQFVTPTHQLPVIVGAVRRAVARGFSRPIVWNCGGYESPEALAVLDGLVDVYLPDLKHGDDVEGRLTGVSDYWQVAQASVAEMFRQVGDLQTGADGLATQGLLVRHLVLPDDAAKSAEVMRFLASLSPGLRVNVMAQYQPVHELAGHVRLGRRTRAQEIDQALALAAQAGLTNAFSMR